MELIVWIGINRRTARINHKIFRQPYPAFPEIRPGKMQAHTITRSVTNVITAK